MALKPPRMDLPIKTSDSGFYKGLTKDVTVTVKVPVSALIIWAIAFPESAGAVLSGVNTFILASFNH